MLAAISSASLRLPTDRPKAAKDISRQATTAVSLTPEVVFHLRELAQRTAVSLFGTLLASCVALLARLSGERELCVGNSVVRLEDEPSVGQLLQRVERALTKAGKNAQACRFVLELVEPTAVAADSSLAAGFTDCELAMSLSERLGGFTGSVQFATELFDLETIERLVRHWEVLLQAMADDTSRPVTRLPLLTWPERNQILRDFNLARVPFPPGNLLHRVFEEQVRWCPDALAVSFRKETLTYSELNGRANQLAEYLRERGVGPDKPVAICVEHSLEMIVGLLAILKAGGAYVPLDPSYPVERLKYILKDCKPAVLLTRGELQRTLSPRAVPVVAFDADWSEISRRPADTNPTVEPFGLTPESLAYVIYTSGSTGTPKGVMVEHRSVTRFLAAVDNWYHFKPGQGWSLFHSFAFDFSVLEIWGALLSGGRLVIVPYATTRFPSDFCALLASERVAVLSQTPSAFRQLITAQARRSIPLSLQTIILGGEALQVRALKSWYEREENRASQITNMYGPTETTVFVTYRPVQRSDTDPHGGSLIGTPVPHSLIYILDENREPVPVGIVGEIYIAGTGVARGYLSRPDLTAERFIADPFCDSPGTRMYRSGDLGLWHPDGTIEYLGRNDSQVKVRGFRVELGDIEAHLAACPGVREAVVVVRKDSPEDARLVAYLTAEEGVQLSAPKVRALLAQRLPIYMVPNEYVILSHLPLSANGKIDRKALPAPLPGLVPTSA
jgi:amino acid adenylation domain-containing protein